MDKLIAIIYFAMVILSVWPIQQWLLKHVLDEAKPDMFDKMMSGFMACIAAVLWPLFVSMYLVVKVSSRIWDRILNNEEEKAHNERS